MGKDENQMKLFKCHDCGQQFYVTDEELDDVVCRNCQSDNVSPVNHKPMLMKILAFVAIAAIGFGVAWLFMKPGETVLPPPPPRGDSIPSLTDIPKIAKVSHSDFIDNGNYTYSFVAKCEFEGKEKTKFKYEYKLMDKYDGKELKTSTDGRFADLSGTESGSYYFKVVISENGTKVETEPMEILGFKKKPATVIEPRILANPWTKEELEDAILSSQASRDKNKHFISPSVKISYTNIRENEGKGPTILADIEGRLEIGLWESIKVVNVSYNKQNVIIAVELEINYP